MSIQFKNALQELRSAGASGLSGGGDQKNYVWGLNSGAVTEDGIGIMGFA